MAVHSTQKMRRIVAEVAELDKKFAPLIERRPLCTIGRSEPSETHKVRAITAINSRGSTEQIIK